MLVSGEQGCGVAAHLIVGLVSFDLRAVSLVDGHRAALVRSVTAMAANNIPAEPSLFSLG